jgi:type IV fimbrial biogenesis protein FimT
MKTHPLARTPRRPQRGVTLIETAVALTIGAIALSTVAPGFQSLVARKRLEGVATQLATDLQFVRTEAVARNLPVRVSFFADSNGSCYLIHTGAKAQCSCASDEAAACVDGAERIKAVYLPAAEHVAVQASAGSILFDPLHGTSTPTGTARVTGTPGAVHHIVNVMGRVRSCSPAPALPGYRTC